MTEGVSELVLAAPGDPWETYRPPQGLGAALAYEQSFYIIPICRYKFSKQYV